MVSKTLMGVWVFLDFSLMVAGVLSVLLSIVWRSSNLLMTMVFSPTKLTVGLVLGISLLVTFAFSIGAIIQANHVTIGLVILNWMLVTEAIGIIIIGSFIWFYTLMERNNFHQVFSQMTANQRIGIQDQLKCCGYFNASDLAEIGGSFCQNTTFVDAQTDFCVTPITAFADASLNLTFTTIFGFMAIVICLFLASMCVIKKRQEVERFKKIDAKRGGRGFV